MNDRIKKMKEQLKTGIKVHVAPLLYPTPRDLAWKMAEMLEIKSTDRILEPSAGTGILLDAIFSNGAEIKNVVAIEYDYNLADHLRSSYHSDLAIFPNDFLLFGAMKKFDKIIMNPPFNGGADVLHIKHALECLAPGGRLIAICANGPRQERNLKSICDLWEPLPDDTFEHCGTKVRSVLLEINK